MYLLIWGEGANLRHCPECLCFLFHQMRAELWRDVPASPRPDGWFLAEVVAPLYKKMRAHYSLLITNYSGRGAAV